MLLFRNEEVILFAVYRLQGNACGVTIREQVNRNLDRYWSFGAIYKILKN